VPGRLNSSCFIASAKAAVNPTNISGTPALISCSVNTSFGGLRYGIFLPDISERISAISEKE